MPINSYSASVTGSLTAIKEPKPFLSQVDNFFYRIYSAVRLCFFNVCVRVCVCVCVSDVLSGSLAAIFSLVYSLSHYKKQNSQTSLRPLPSNHLAPADTSTLHTMPSR